MINKTEEQQKLLELIPSDGSNVGNISLRRELGWDDKKYWQVRDELVDGDVLALVRCRGGGVRLAHPKESEESDLPEETLGSETSKSEREYYNEIEQTLREQWTQSMGFRDFVVEQTAHQGRRETGGTWTRPDIVVIVVTNLRYVPGRQIDVVTIEVKRAVDADITAVYEALAHLRRATKSYLLIVGKSDRLKQELPNIREEASRHGVGLIVAEEPNDFQKWEFELEPERRDTNASALDEFIDEQMSSENKKNIALWVK